MDQGGGCVAFLHEERADGYGERENEEVRCHAAKSNRERLVIAEAAALDLNVQDEGARHGADENEEQERS